MSSSSCSVCNSNYYLSSGSCLVTPNSASSSASSAESTMISTVTVATVIILASSILSFSSFTTIWTIMNQIQTLFFVLLTRVYLPYDVIYFIVGLNFAMFPYDYFSFKSSSASTSINDLFNFNQEDDILSQMGLESGSTFVNNYSLFLAIVIYALINLYIIILSKLVNKLKPYYPKVVKIFNWFYTKVYKFMIFGLYIRTLLEAYQYLLISCLYEFHYFNGSSGPRIASFFSALEMLLFCIAFFFLTIWFSIWRTTNEEENDKYEEFLADLKTDLLSKIYLIIIMTRRFLFIVLCASLGFASPVATISLMFIFQLIYVIYLIYQKPFTKIKLNIVEIITEVFLLFFLCWLFYFNSESTWNYSSTQAIIWMFSGVNMIILIIVTVDLIILIINKIKSFKAKKPQTETVVNECPAQGENSEEIKVEFNEHNNDGGLSARRLNPYIKYNHEEEKWDSRNSYSVNEEVNEHNIPMTVITESTMELRLKAP